MRRVRSRERNLMMKFKRVDKWHRHHCYQVTQGISELNQISRPRSLSTSSTNDPRFQFSVDVGVEHSTVLPCVVVLKKIENKKMPFLSLREEWYLFDLEFKTTKYLPWDIILHGLLNEKQGHVIVTDVQSTSILLGQLLLLSLCIHPETHAYMNKPLVRSKALTFQVTPLRQDRTGSILIDPIHQRVLIKEIH